MSIRHPLLLDLAVVFSLALLPVLYFWRLFASNPVDQMTIAEGDFTQEYFPVLLTAARALRDGALPLWNPLSNGGQPLLADPQSALLYPPTWLALVAMQGFDGESLVAFERLVPLHFSLAGGFTYLLGRVLLRSRIGALVAALTFTYSGFLTSYPVQQLPILRVVVWLPLQVLCLWLALERRSLTWAGLGGLAFGLAVLGGHPQTALLEAVGLGVVAVVWTYQQAVSGRRSGWWGPTTLLVLAGVGLGVSAAQWLPTYEFARLSSRPGVGYEFLKSGFSLWELPLNLLAPKVLGGLPPYVGVLPLMLALAALALRPARVHGVALALGVVGLVLSLGGHSFAYPLLYRLAPGFDLFRNQERAIFLFTLATALLAGSGAAMLCARLNRPERLRLARVTRLMGVLLMGLAALGGALYVGQLSAEVSAQGVHRWRDMVHWVFFAVLLLSASVGLLLARTHVRALRRALPLLVVALVTFDLFTVSWETNLQARQPDDVFRASAIVKHLQQEVGAERVHDVGVMNGNHGLVYGIPTVSESFALHLDRFERATKWLAQDRFFDLLNVGYVVTREDKPELGQVVLREQFRDITNRLYKRTAPHGAAYVTADAEAASSPDEALAFVAESGFEPRRKVILEGLDSVDSSRGGPGSVGRLAREWNALRLEVDAPRGGYLVLSEIAYPGWRAEVDGQSQPLLRANYLLRALVLQPGAQQVTLRYEPQSLAIGLLVSLGAVLSLLGWVVARSIGRRRTTRRS